MLTLPQQNLVKIISQSSPLSERMRNNGQLQAMESSSNALSEAVEKRLEHWSQVVGKGDRDKFLRRLGFEGWDVNVLRSVLETTGNFDGGFDDREAEALSSVSWGQTFQEILAAAKEQSQQENWLDWVLVPEKKPCPFEAFYAPFLQVAIRKLHQVVDLKKINYLTESAQISLYSGLLDRLVEIATPTLFHEFSEFRSTDNALKNFFNLQFQGRNHRDKYESFLKQLFQDQYYSLFEIYPVLGKLLAIAVDFWVEMAVELLDRLGSDWTALSQQFSQTALQQVVEIQMKLSDPHNRGRSTLILTFDTGLKVVYKPKDLGTDVAFFGTLQWCNDRGLELPFQCLSVLNRGHYGWIEHVPKTPCEDEAAVQRFYQRSGMLLCLIHVLEGTDCHHENLIACGEQPILIDTETLLTPRMAATRSESTVEDQTESLSSKQVTQQNVAQKKVAQHWVEEQLSESVIRTMLLPHWDIIKDENHDLDLSGFGGGHAQQLMGMQWRDVNTDAMQLEITMLTMEAQGNAPTLKDPETDQAIVIDPEGYLDALVVGFETMYQFLLQHRSDLLDPKGPLQKFEQETLRYVFRATNTYAVTLQQSYQPELMKSGIDRSIALEIMSRAFIKHPEKPNFYPFLSIELQAMEQIDIPFFTFNASSRDVVLSNGEVVSDLWIKSGLDQVRSRIESLSSQDLQQQSEVIRGTFDARFLAAPVQATAKAKVATQETGTPRTVDYVQNAIAIAEQLRQTAIFGDEESVTWLGLGARSLRDGFQYGGMGVDLFSGSCGIGLFFAALAHTTGDRQWHDLALQTVRGLRDTLHLTASNPDIRDRWIRNQGISGTTGIAGLVYGLSQMSVYLDDPSLNADAEHFVQLIRPEASNRAPSYAVARGVAGTILGLLALPDNGDAMRLAVAAGEYLVQTQGAIAGIESTGIESKCRAWVNPSGDCPVGFYDGIAGISYALLRLFQVTQDEQFRSAAIEAIEVERELLTMQQPPVNWAQGAAGIGLARLGCLSMVDTPELRQEIESALALTEESGIWGVDSLCWGNFGRLELLLVAAERFDRPQLRQLTEVAIAEVLQQADDRGRFEVCPDRTYPSQVPGLFTGLAGIGYQLLRMQNPRLSSVLLWEAQH
jgi:type 2 lantibiotic biosynthesis protein LanM